MEVEEKVQPLICLVHMLDRVATDVQAFAMLATCLSYSTCLSAHCSALSALAFVPGAPWRSSSLHFMHVRACRHVMPIYVHVLPAYGLLLGSACEDHSVDTLLPK